MFFSLVRDHTSIWFNRGFFSFFFSFFKLLGFFGLFLLDDGVGIGFYGDSEMTHDSGGIGRVDDVHNPSVACCDCYWGFCWVGVEAQMSELGWPRAVHKLNDIGEDFQDSKCQEERRNLPLGASEWWRWLLELRRTEDIFGSWFFERAGETERYVPQTKAKAKAPTDERHVEPEGHKRHFTVEKLKQNAERNKFGGRSVHTL